MYNSSSSSSKCTLKFRNTHAAAGGWVAQRAFTQAIGLSYVGGADVARTWRGNSDDGDQRHDDRRRERAAAVRAIQWRTSHAANTARRGARIATTSSASAAAAASSAAWRAGTCVSRAASAPEACSAAVSSGRAPSSRRAPRRAPCRAPRFHRGDGARGDTAVVAAWLLVRRRRRRRRRAARARCSRVEATPTPSRRPRGWPPPS